MADPRSPRPGEPEVRGARLIPNGAELDLFIPPDLAYLEGHFPQQPIVPGVVLIDWVVLFAARHLNVPVEAAKAFAVKFRRLMLPGDSVTLIVHHTPGRPRLEFEYRNRQCALASGTISIA
jgi:3-hydroxymyristoyl/3-hydroxydecanoyl-(acyl carrier protein) dehydratase